MKPNTLLAGWAALATLGLIVTTIMLVNRSPETPAPLQPKDQRPSEVSKLPDQKGPSETGSKPAKPSPLARRIEELTEELATARAEKEHQAKRIKSLEDQLAPHLAEETVTVQSVMALIQDLKGKGLSSLLEPGKTNKLVSDLRQLGAQGTDAILDMLQSEDTNERILAAKLLGDLGDPRAIAALGEAAMDEEEIVARMSSQSLALMGHPEALPTLRSLYDESEDPGVKVNTLFGLCKLGEKKGLDEALAFFKDEDQPERLRMALGQGILLLDEPHVMPIVKFLAQADKPSEGLGMLAVQYFGKINDAEARSALQDILNDQAYPARIRDLAAEALRQ